MKHARDMTDAEFEEANRRKAWRTPPAQPRVDRRKIAREMTDTEFTAACLLRAWRTHTATA